MFKKLKQKIYNKKTAKLLENIKFDDFAYIADSEIPMFSYVDERIENRIYAKFFVPQTEEMLILATKKLKKHFFMNIVEEDYKNRVMRFIAYSTINIEAFDKCMDIFKIKQEIYCGIPYTNISK